MTRNLKLLINFVWKFMGTVCFGNDHVAAILGFGDLQWGNILITRVYFIEGLSHNLFSVRQFCDSDLEVAFIRNACFVRNLEGVDLLKEDRSTNLYTINLHEMASASPIYLMARTSSTKSWLWHQRLSYLNFDTINDLARNDLVTGLPKFKYHKEHLCPSCEQGKSKRASHPPEQVPNLRQRLNLLHMDLCGPMRITSINGKRSDYKVSEKDHVERRNWTLVEAARTMLIFSRAPLFLWDEAIATACFTQNRSIIHRRFNKTPYELINCRKPDISFLHVFGALCYPKNDREDIGKLGAKGDIGFFIGYSADSCAYRVYNRQTKKIMETMNVSFDELSTLAFKQRSSKPELQSMTSGQISLGLDLTYAPSTITTQQPSKEPQVCQSSTASTTIADTAPIPTNSSSHATNVPITSQDVDELHPNAIVDGNTFVNPFANSPTSAAASSSQQNVDPSNMHTVYNRQTKKIIETMNVSFDELSAMAFEQSSSKPRLNSELDLLFEAMYDDYIGGQPSATARTVPPAQEPQVRQSSTVSTTIADTAPIPTNSSSLTTNIPISSQDVDELNPNAMVDGNTFVNLFANSSTSAAASSSHQNDHPLEQVIGEPSRPILTRNQLQSDGDMCMYALSVSTMEPKNVKEAMIDLAWIDSMQEELLQFKRLDVWVLVPA
nr:integrase, catalytic region, zinc finger, CCHC-type, peptidase aspartic, catalytic [Tanacetum cinerariifolium]